MSDKNKLAGMFKKDQQKPQIQRGQGVRLSTSTPDTAQEEDCTNAQTHKSASAETQQRTLVPTEPRRISQGFKLRADLIKACKRIALDDDRKLYEVMEEALQQYIDRRKSM
jgi:hypothetical protein